MTKRGARWLGVGVAFAFVVAMYATATPAAFAATASPTTLLDALVVRGETHSSTYVRSKFRHWIDADGDGCDARKEVLQRDSSRRIACRSATGKWYSPYDGKVLTLASGIDIDHMVPLKEAWESGAWNWTSAQRQTFANDLGYTYSLVAASASSNRSKGDKDPDDWMPSRSSFHCTYVSRWIAVKYRWHLTVDSSEKSQLRSVLASCSSGLQVILPARINSVTEPPAGSGGGSGANDPRYSTCTAAKAAGYGPYRRGVDPEYAWYTDRDNDGIACE
ncbi:MAG: hypothetical protein RLZZ600_1285 [Actinomycetota bacterium]|jgi:hypothetical protein